MVAPIYLFSFRYMDTFGDWLGRELERSPDFAQERERLRDEALRPRRATKRLADLSGVEEMRAELQESRDTPRPKRDRCWKSDAHMRHTWVDEPCEPLAHVERYGRRLQTRAYHFTGATANADALHAHICGSVLDIPIPGAIASLPAPVGHRASSIAAGFNGDVRWRAGTSRQAFNRHVADVDAAGSTFYYRRGIEPSTD